MTTGRAIAWLFVAAGIAAGTLADSPAPSPRVELGGYRVLAADFHTHPFPLSGSTLAPWDLVLEARRQGLDVIAITPQNGALPGKIGRWFSRLAGGPAVIAGEEIHGPRFHLIALGTERYISWRLPAGQAIDEVHRQGGVAIAAHPIAGAWAAYDSAARLKLDGAEVWQPVVYSDEDGRRAAELQEFYEEAPVAAIGSSDYHGVGPLGLCRTYVFARGDSAEAVLDAIRAHRTVVVAGGRVYGDPALVPFAPALPPPPRRPSPFGGLCGAAGLIGLIVLPRR